MSFIKESKTEVLNRIKITKQNAVSFLFGIFKTAGEFNLTSKQMKILSNLEGLYNALNLALKTLNFEEASLEISEEKSFNSNFKYEITFSEKASVFLMNAFMDNDFEKEYLYSKTQKLAFIKAIFLTSATGTIKINAESKSYLLEFVFTEYDLSELFCEMLANFDVLSKKIVRKTQYIVYLNKLDFISDFFALIGASKSVLKLQNESALRNLRNNINRQNNCLEANINKTISASSKQIDAINVIENTVGIESLDYSLQEICLLRLANPEESLEELLKLLNNKISKSGLYHRFNKIIKIAKMLE